MRFATEMLKNPGQYYMENAVAQDIAETLAGAGISAGGQLLFTDMDPTEIGISSGLGIGAAMAARPIGARVGYGAGRAFDKHFPNAGDNELIGAMMVGSPQAIKVAQSQNMPEIVQQMHQAKYNQNYVRPDGTERGFLEGGLGMWGRQYIDNVAQLGVAAASPLVMSTFREPQVGEPTAQLPT